MAKTLKDFLEGYLKVKSADEQKFIDKHVTAKNPDRNGNGDDVFKGNTKTIDRRKDRKGYNPGEDEKVYEALKGNQHKIDANKNGKVDAHDFKLLRSKKKVAEEAEQIDELSHDTLRSYRMKAKSIADHGGDQRTKGRELAGRKSYGGRMAGVEKAKVMAKEEAEQIDELSTKTLRSYLQKNREAPSERQYKQKHNQGYERAVGKLTGQSYRAVGDQGVTIGHKKPKVLSTEETTLEEGMERVVDDGKTPIGRATQHAAKLISSHTKRKHYFDGGDLVDHETDKTVVHNAAGKTLYAVKKLAKEYHAGVKEEAEQIDELSKATMGSYAQKAKDDLSRSDYLAGKKMGERQFGAKPDNAERKLNAKASKRYKGLGMAINKLAKEEAQIDEKLSAKSPMGTYIKDFQKSDAPQFKGKSPEKRRVMAIAAKLTAERGGKPLNKEERLQARLGDLSESHKRTMTNIFEKLNEDNKSKFLEACDTPEGIEQMLDFAINHRGE